MRALETLTLAAAAAVLPIGGFGAGLRAPSPPPAAASAAPDFSWHKEMAPGTTLEIKGVNGEIEAVAASGNEAEVTATKQARRSDPDDVTIKVLEHDGGITICAVYPTPRRSSHENECGPGDAGHMNTNNNDVSVHFRVRVPKGVHFVGRTVNGDVDATGMPADAEASTVNGSIDLSAAGRAEASTVNGSLRISMGRADFAEGAHFSTVNGGVELTLPADINADLSVKTVNGDITSDFPVTVTGKFGPRRVRGTLGKGGPDLKIETVNGDITLRRS